ncbi:MAG: SAP domain-containing protein [Desulfobacterales bacterium SG8_35]|nr:MAG: SAP domain-containing protein [Desulfobacterales bacterium SG8_35]
MTVKEIKTVAKKMGIQAGKMKKTDLVRTIQAAEGNMPCFQTGVLSSCDQENCCWRSDCM